jgi:hypothetical protein
MDFIESSVLLLKNQRMIFHSEDDLKFSLAISIKENNPDFHIRLERPVAIEMIDRNNKKSIVRAPIDMIVIDDKGNTIPIELKYKTKKTNISHNGEDYLLTNHGATDIGRFSFRKDIYRIEQYLLKHTRCDVGYVLVLTNDHAYFENNVFEKNIIDKHFSFHHGFLINRLDKSWNYESIDKAKYVLDITDNTWRYCNQPEKHWTCKKELFYKLDLVKDYEIDWKDYSKIRNIVFKYCLIRVDKY